MHKHLTSAAVQDARHEHRLKTTLLSRSSASATAQQQQPYGQAAGSLNQQRLTGNGSNARFGATAYGAAAASATANFTFHQSRESTEYSTQQQQYDNAGPLRSGMASYAQQQQSQDLPTSWHASNAAASGRIDVAMAAAVSTSPTKARGGGSMVDSFEQQLCSSQQYTAQQQGYAQQVASKQQWGNKYPNVPMANSFESNEGCDRSTKIAAATAALDDAFGSAAVHTSVPESAQLAAAPPSGSGYAARLFKATGKALSSKGQGAGSSDGNKHSSKAPGPAVTAVQQTQVVAGVSLAAEMSYSQQQQAGAARLLSAPTVTKQGNSQGQSAEQPGKQQPQQHRQTAAEVQRQTSSSFGVRISGSVMAAFNGWLVNEAVNAATSAATAAATAALGGNGSGAKPSPATPAADAIALTGRRSSSDAARWSIGGFLRSSFTPGQQAEQQQQQQQQSARRRWSKDKAAAAAADDDDDDDDALEPAAEAVTRHLGSLAQRCSSGSSGSSDDDADGTGADVDMEDVQLQTGSSSSEGDGNDSDADVGILSDEDMQPATSQQHRNRKRRLAAAEAAAQGTGIAGAADDSNTGFVVVKRPRVAKKAKALKGLLLWRSKGASAKALGIGLYMVMLISYVPQALEYMQVTTLLPGVALLYLAYNLAKPWVIRCYCRISGKHAPQLSNHLATFEGAAADKLVALGSRAAAEAGLWMLAVLSLAHKALCGQKFTTTAWTILSLWLLLLISELRVVNQTVLSMAAYCGLFGVPWLYSKFKQHIDTLVYDTMHLLTLLVVHAERWAYGLAAIAAAVVWQMMESEEGSVVVQGTAAGLAGLAVLVWRVVAAET